MSLNETFNPEQIAQDITMQIYQRMVDRQLTEEEVQNNANIIFEFAKIAGSLVLQEPGITPQGSETVLPYTEPIAKQTVELFCEGIYHGTVKCEEYGIDGELKSQMLQGLAQDAFQQTKQIVASTYGQENTPDFQFTWDQQVQWIQQAVDTTMGYFIAEYEKENGPLKKPEPREMAAPSVETEPAALPAPVPAPESVSPVVSEAAQEPAMPAASPQELPVVIQEQPPATVEPAQPPLGLARQNPYDKFAAIALLITTIPQLHRHSILSQFSREERAIIDYYSDIDRIEQELDIVSVERHLKQLKNRLEQEGKEATSRKTRAFKAFQALLPNIPAQQLLETFEEERPLVQRYIQQALDVHRGQKVMFSNPLPPKIEESLVLFIKKCLVNS